MGECLRRACPCLEPLWQRVFNDKKPSPEDPGGGGAVVQTEPSPAQTSDRVYESSSIYTALWSFEARHQDELSFQEGDLFCVLSRSGDWWTARKIDKNGRVLDTGIVPNNYLARAESLEMQPWFYGKMNRFEAQGHLMGPGNEEGAFLIRHSEKDNIGYVLSGKKTTREFDGLKL